MELSGRFMERSLKGLMNQNNLQHRGAGVASTGGTDSASVLSRLPCFLSSNFSRCLDKENAGAASQGSLLSGFSSADLQRRCNGDGSIALGRFFQGSLRRMAAADGKQSNKSLQQGSLGKTC
ncbi:unnamed protein product [Sphagnum troendelagicum]|jgi:hypothetical protein|uniref:Uncharacterized protein n=1 Tax=Sphagnum jensenii TaxID=128206 RepID=A0ABP0WSN0_9BRYO